MATDVGAPQLAVQHMRQSCQRMPIAGMLAAERVNSARNRQPTTDERIRVNVGIIIVVDEVVADSLPENEPRYCNEKNADNCDCAARAAPCNVRIFGFSHIHSSSVLFRLRCSHGSVSRPHRITTAHRAVATERTRQRVLFTASRYEPLFEI